MSKRPGEGLPPLGNGSKVPKVDPAAGAVKKPDAAPRLPMLMYKDGEPLRELLMYYNKEGGPQAVEVRIPAHCLTSNNRQVRARQVWGSDVYTQDSDLVAVLMHCGYWHHSITHPPPQVAEVRAVLQPLAPQPSYASTARNSIRSRAWAAPVEGCSYSVDKCWVVTRSGTSVDLSPNLDGIPAATPTFTPSHLERIVTRSAGGANRQRQIQEVTVVFNLVNEPWLKYNMLAVADKGLKPHEWTSARLHTHVLYLESATERFELSRIPPPAAAASTEVAGTAGSGSGGAGGSPGEEERYRFSRCRRPLSALQLRRVGVPLPEGECTLLHDNLAWEEIQWGPQGVTMAGSSYRLMRVHFFPMEAEEEEQGEGGDS